MRKLIRLNETRDGTLLVPLSGLNLFPPPATAEKGAGSGLGRSAEVREGLYTRVDHEVPPVYNLGHFQQLYSPVDIPSNPPCRRVSNIIIPKI